MAKDRISRGKIEDKHTQWYNNAIQISTSKSVVYFMIENIISIELKDGGNHITLAGCMI